MKGLFSPAALALIACGIWSIALGTSTIWNLKNAEQRIMESAYAEVRTARDRDMAVRRWVLKHTGVYVVESDKVSPNKFLSHVPDRDIQAEDGRKLTLRGAASVVREMMDDMQDPNSARSRIVGLKTLNPANAPDPWEKKQLEAFIASEKQEVTEISTYKGTPHLRYLQAWYMSDGCVKCHSILGYKVGDMRGATGVNVPLAPYYQRLDALRSNLLITHGSIWLLGILGIGWAGRKGILHQRESDKAYEKIRLHTKIFEHSGEGILVSDHENKIVAVNPKVVEMSGYAEQELLGKDPKILASGKTPRDVYQEMWRVLNAHGEWQGELLDKRKDGTLYPKWVTISTIVDKTGTLTHYIASFVDISELKTAQAHIERLAHHDSLTGLLNRYSFEHRLDQALANAQRNPARLGLMFIDLDHFKRINDSLGHAIGDQLLIEASARMRSMVRDSDIVARLGGDEFVIVLTDMETPLDATNVSKKLLDSLAQPFHLEGNTLHTSLSIGISVFPDDGNDALTLMKHADAAMYQAKKQGRNNAQFFTADMTDAANEQLSLEHDLREALDQQQFELYYQPQVCSQSGKVCGVEALLRWHHPTQGMISPLKFIPIAEDAGLIEPIGLWVLETACKQIAVWRQTGLRGVRVAINLSAIQLRSRALVSQVIETMSRHAIAPGELEFEITESAAMSDPIYATHVLQVLQNLGAQIAIDDFGTGYSSLAYLKRLPVNSLKIDRSFVQNIDVDENDASISTSILALAHSMGLRVTAEGVETAAQRETLIRLNCDCLQGYYFSKPVPAADCEQVIQERGIKQS